MYNTYCISSVRPMIRGAGHPNLEGVKKHPRSDYTISQGGFRSTMNRVEGPKSIREDAGERRTDFVHSDARL